MARALERSWRSLKATKPFRVIADRLWRAQLEVRGAMGSIGRLGGAPPRPADAGSGRSSTASAPLDAGRPVDDWSPTEVLTAASLRWVRLGEVNARGPAEELAARLAAYRRGRARLIRSLLGRDGGQLCVW